MSLLISGGTILDVSCERTIRGRSIWVEGERIRAVCLESELPVTVRREAKTVDAGGRYVVPGLMNANVHLLGDTRFEVLARYWGRFDDLILEAAQVTLRGGLTTVFDTWGPRANLRAVKERISSGREVGSRIFFGGNIVGLDGPLSEDFYPKAVDVASRGFAERINTVWVQNVGKRLQWLTPAGVGEEVRAYIRQGVDFIKYASNEHLPASTSAFLCFSPDVQAAIVREAHEAGISAQAHAMSVEGLRVAVQAGCELIQHANITGMVPIPPETLELMARKECSAVVFPLKEYGFKWLMDRGREVFRLHFQSLNENARRIIESGVAILAATDGALWAPEAISDPLMSNSTVALPESENLFGLEAGHFVWFEAMEEMGCRPWEMLKAATQNIAVAYGLDKDLGTIEAGKLADVVILDRSPLEGAKNYRTIGTIIKGGQIVDRGPLPQKAILTADPRVLLRVAGDPLPPA